jgi:hypothetical protein
MSPSPLSHTLLDLLSRGHLPARVRLVRDVGPLSAGALLTWSEAGRGYFSEDGKHAVLALSVAPQFGSLYVEA